MTIGLVVVMVGGFWTLAYIPIDNNQKRLEKQINDLRAELQHHMTNDDAKYLTQKEHNEFKHNTERSDEQQIKNFEALKNEMERAVKREEFISEIKRLDQSLDDDMKRKEFEMWRLEREKTIAAIQDRQNRFSEALDSMYSRLMQQMPSYQQKQ